MAQYALVLKDVDDWAALPKGALMCHKGKSTRWMCYGGNAFGPTDELQALCFKPRGGELVSFVCAEPTTAIADKCLLMQTLLLHGLSDNDMNWWYDLATRDAVGEGRQLVIRGPN